jgi:hypothetical protein
MKKTILTIGLLCTLLQGCAYKPIIDTAGRSGTFNKDKAKEHYKRYSTLCEHTWQKKILIQQFSLQTLLIGHLAQLWLMPKAEYTRKKLIKNCLLGRGHNVIN